MKELEIPFIMGRKTKMFQIHAFFIRMYFIRKNVEAEISRKFKNVLRMFRGSNSNQHQNLSL